MPNYALAACYGDLLYYWYDLVSQDIERFLILNVPQAEDAVIDAHFCQASKVVNGGLRVETAIASIFRDCQGIQRGFLYLLIWTIERCTVLTQHVQLMLQHIVAHASEEVAGIAVLRNHPQRLLLSRAADQNM